MRNNKIKELRKEGWTLQRIGERFNITRERVRQICLSKAGMEIVVHCFCCGRKQIRYYFRKDHRKVFFCSGCFDEYFRYPSGYPFEGREYTRQVVRIRDNNKCTKCHRQWLKGERRFDIHHLYECGLKSRAYDKIEDLERLITLCHKCHMGLHSVKERMKDKSSQRPNKEKDEQYVREWKLRTGRYKRAIIR